MTLVIAYHEVDDREHWLASPKREEILGSLGVSFKGTFIDPENADRVAILVDVPDIGALASIMQSPDVGAAMAHDGVRTDTVVMLIET
jgi:hypothetical protein